jgi:hypothetical protein
MLDGVVPPLLVLSGSLLFAAFRRFLVRASKGGRWIDPAAVVAIVVLAGLLELGMGRPPTYRNGPIRLWSGDVNSDQNSQQVLDPYSFTHLIHGAVFYGLTRAVLPAAPFRLCALVVVTLESAWEVYENTDQVINRYRAGTVSHGYSGDTILNSMSDIVVCLIGLLLAWRLPPRVTVCSVLVIELVLAWWIRDNLTLNIIMLVHPFPAVRAWQTGA